jgi:hypothetical protein
VAFRQFVWPAACFRAIEWLLVIEIGPLACIADLPLACIERELNSGLLCEGANGDCFVNPFMVMRRKRSRAAVDLETSWPDEIMI